MSASPSSRTVSSEELQLRSADQTRLFVRRVRPDNPRARLAWVHGFGEHGGRYLPTLHWLAERGFESLVLDLRGHGRSAGRRTYVRRFADYLDDLEAFLTWQGREAPGALFALGHSMGGLVLSRTLQERAHRLPELRGALILSPFLGASVKIPLWKVLLARTLSRVMPWFALPTDVDVSLLSKDPAVGEAYMTDPLVVKTATTRWFTETMKAHGLARRDAARMSLPLLLMHGDADGLASIDATRQFHGQVGSPDKELKEWPGGRHELLNEVEKDQVREHILSWVEKRLEA